MLTGCPSFHTVLSPEIVENNKISPGVNNFLTVNFLLSKAQPRCFLRFRCLYRLSTAFVNPKNTEETGVLDHLARYPN